MWHNFWVALPKYTNMSNKHSWSDFISGAYCAVINMNPNRAFWIAFALLLLRIIDMNSCKCLPFHPVSELGKWMHANPEVAFLRRQRHLRRIRFAPYTWTISRPAKSWFDIHYLSPLLFLRPFVVLFFFRFSAKPSANLELVGLSLSPTILAGLSDRLSKIPLGPAWSMIGSANVWSKWRKFWLENDPGAW